MLGVDAMNSTILAGLAAVVLAWQMMGKRYHAAGLAAALKRTTIGDTAPAPVFESLFGHYDALLRRGCSSAEIHALVMQSFQPWERHHLQYIRRCENAAGYIAGEEIDAATLNGYINSMRLFKERCYPHICGRDRRHPRPRMMSIPRI